MNGKNRLIYEHAVIRTKLGQSVTLIDRYGRHHRVTADDTIETLCAKTTAPLDSPAFPATEPMQGRANIIFEEGWFE